jgi:hypothetical protein
MALITLHTGLICLFEVDTSFAEIFGITFLGGLGLGIVLPATVIAIISSIEPKHLCKYCISKVSTNMFTSYSYRKWLWAFL